MEAETAFEKDSVTDPFVMCEDSITNWKRVAENPLVTPPPVNGIIMIVINLRWLT